MEKHKNPNTGYICVYNPECPICEEYTAEQKWLKTLEKELEGKKQHL